LILSDVNDGKAFSERCSIDAFDHSSKLDLTSWETFGGLCRQLCDNDGTHVILKNDDARDVKGLTANEDAVDAHKLLDRL